MSWTKEQVGKAATDACFYVTPEGEWLRIRFTALEDEVFYTYNDDTGDCGEFYFREVAKDPNPHFERATRITLDSLKE